MRIVAVALLCSSLWPLAAGASRFDDEVRERRARFAREAGRPQAIVPLLGVLDLWDLVSDTAPIVALLDEAASSARARADVRARATYLRSLALDRLGRNEEAAKLRGGLGLVTKFLVAGPFDNEGRAGHAAVHGPESAPFDPGASWDGKERKVSWRALPEIAVQGLVPLDAMLRPDTHATAYAIVAVKVPRAVDAAVRVGSTGAVKVWVNGRLSLDHDAYRPVRIDQDVGGAALQPGWNRVLVKASSGESGGWSFFLRLTRPDGAPLEGVEISSDPQVIRSASAKPAKPRVQPADLARDLGRPRDAAGYTDLGLYLHFVAPEDPERHEAAAALLEAARRAPSALAYERLAKAHLDPNDQRKALEAGLKHAGKDGVAAAPLYTALGEVDYRARRDRRAEASWQRALAGDPDYFPATIKLAELQGDRGLPARAQATLDELATRLGQAAPVKVARALAGLATRRGRRVEADRLLERVDEKLRDDGDALHERFSFARARGDVPVALALNDRLRRARPDLLSALGDRAELLDGAGRSDEALRAYETALAICPEDAKLLEKQARLLHRLGRTADALERMRRALALRPQNPELRAYVSEIETRTRAADADPRADLARAWAEEVPPLIAEARKKPDATGSPARVILDQQVTRVHANGLSESYAQRTIEILDDRGARAAGDFDIRYTPDTQTVEVRAARVYKKSGEVLEAISTEDQDASEPWYGLYYDVRAQVVKFSALEPGDVVDVQYVVSDVGRKNMFADYFGEMHFFQEEMPRLDSRYVVLAPRTRTLYFNTPKLDGGATVSRTDEQRGDERVYKFRAIDVPKIHSEPGMPGWSEVSAYVHVSTYRTWEDVATWYTGLVRSQLEPSAAITRAAREAVKGKKSEREKIRALYDYVVKKTRYVGLEFGIHGYQPYKVSQVFARKFGDCKDKASLLVVMLKEVGIEASLVLARTRRGGDVTREPASLAPFDHAIVWVPKYDLYLDGTAEFSGADELPAQDQDIPVVLVSQKRLARTPVMPAAKNGAFTEWRAALAEDGSARVEERMVVTGEAAHEWRSHYQSPGERQEKYAQAWNGKQPGARLEKLEMSVEDLGKPVEVRASALAPHLGRPEGDALVVPALGRDPDMLRSYARLSARRHDLVLGYPWRQEERIAWTLPAGFAPRRLPEARQVATPFGKFELKVNAQAGRVEVVATLEVARHRIGKAEYPAFRAFCADVDAAIGQEMVIAKGSAK